MQHILYSSNNCYGYIGKGYDKVVNNVGVSFFDFQTFDTRIAIEF